MRQEAMLEARRPGSEVHGERPRKFKFSCTGRQILVVWWHHGECV
jgi:hypothetical protein